MFAFLPRPLAVSLLACSAAAMAQAPSESTIVVTGAREPTRSERLAGDLVVIDRGRIEAGSATTVEELLRREAGLQLSRSGGPGANAGLFIRGAGSGNTLVLVDGVRIGSGTLGIPEFESLSLASIERIEVLRGPASSLYGADGSGGVVQVFTRGGGAPQVGARVAAGGYGAREASVNASGRVGAFDLAGSLAHEQLRGVSALAPNDAFGNYNPDADGFRRGSLQARLGWQLAPGQRLGFSTWHSVLNSRYDASQFLPPNFQQDANADFRNRQLNQATQLEHRGEWGAQWVTTLRLSAQKSDLESGAAVISRYLTTRRQFDAQATWNPSAEQRLTLAYEGLREKAEAAGFTAPQQRDNDALVVAYAGAAGPLQLQAEWRHDRNSVYGSVDTGRLGAVWPLGAGWRLRALAGSSFRAPSFNDLFFPGYGVTTIRPERGRSLEAGVDGTLAGATVAATLWRNRVRDLIAYEGDRSFCPADPAYDFGCARNIGRARLQGATLSAARRLDAWSLRAQLDFVDARDAATRERLPRRAAHQASLGADYDGGRWQAGASLLQVGARPDAGVLLPATTTLDLQGRWRFDEQWTLEAKLLNATDRTLTPARDYQDLGRQAWIGLRYGAAGR